MTEQTTRALAAAEVHGVVHRDLKPSNIMIESDPSGTAFVKIIDYGVAKVLAAEPSILSSRRRPASSARRPLPARSNLQRP